MRIFLSYSRADSDVAERVYANLKQSGHAVFFDRENIRAAEDFTRVIWSEIRQSDLFVFLLSPDSIRPGSYALTELSLAEKKWPNPERQVLTVMVRPVDLSKVPVYASICNYVQPEGDIPVEARAAVEALYRIHQRRRLGRAAVLVLGLIVITTLAALGYREYLDQRPLKARQKLVAMEVYDNDSFLQSAAAGDLEMVDLYLTAGMGPNTSSNRDNRRGVTVLMSASAGGHLETVRKLLQAGAEINATSLSGYTALEWAAANGHDDILRELLVDGANKRALNSAFVAAGRDGWLAALQLLLAHEVDTAAVDEVFVIAAGSGDTEIPAALLDYVSERRVVASGALVAAAGNSSLGSEGPLPGIFDYLLDLGADVDIHTNLPSLSGDAHRFTPLTLAVHYSTAAVVKLLLAEGADVDLRCACSGLYAGGWTPLTLAIKHPGTDSVAALLIAGGADVNLAQENNGEKRTPLMYAAESGDTQLVKALLAKGARVNEQNHNGYTVLLYASEHTEVLAMLREAGADPLVGANPLIPLVGRESFYDDVENLLAVGADVNKAGKEGLTPLMKAAGSAGPDMVRLLLANGARPAEEDRLGRTAETFAKRQQQAEIIELLRGE